MDSFIFCVDLIMVKFCKNAKKYNNAMITEVHSFLELFSSWQRHEHQECLRRDSMVRDSDSESTDFRD